MSFLQEFYDGTLNIAILNYAFVIMHFMMEPISLFSVVNKIITKVLATRLNKKLHLLIDEA